MAGAAAVELAIVLIVLVVITFGITELGRMLYQENSLTKAVNIGARYIARKPGLFYSAKATDDPPCGVMDSGEWANAQAAAKNLIICGNPDSCSGSEPVVPGLTADTITITAATLVSVGPSGDPAKGCRFEIDADAPFVPIFGDLIVPFTTLTGVTLNAHTEERYIGE